MRIETKSGHVIQADDADYPLLWQFSWYVVKTQGERLYAHARMPRTGKRVLMHRLLMSPPPGAVVHHRNNNGLDNRRANLEITTNRQNILYGYTKKTGGVHFHSKNGKWRAQCRHALSTPHSRPRRRHQ